MMSTGTGKCKWCGKPMKFVRTAKGHAMPLDPTPDQDKGNVLVLNGEATVLTKENLERARVTNTVLHTSHFATCESPFNPANQRKKS